MTFEECCVKCVKEEELVSEFNRLSGFCLGQKRLPVEKAIDEACGYDPDKEAFPAFCRFVYEYIWAPLLAMQDKEEEQNGGKEGT